MFCDLRLICWNQMPSSMHRREIKSFHPPEISSDLLIDVLIIDEVWTPCLNFCSIELANPVNRANRWNIRVLIT